MFTMLSSSVSTGKGTTKKEISFEYKALVPTADTDAKALVESWGSAYTYARIVAILNKKSERDAGNVARGKGRVSKDKIMMMSMSWAMRNDLERCLEMQALGEDRFAMYLTDEIWHQAQGAV